MVALFGYKKLFVIFMIMGDLVFFFWMIGKDCLVTQKSMCCVDLKDGTFSVVANIG